MKTKKSLWIVACSLMTCLTTLPLTAQIDVETTTANGTVSSTATTADFDLADGIAAVGGAGQAAYKGATGQFSITGGDQSVMIGSSSTNTITQLSITGDGGGGGYTLFFGTTVVTPAVTEIPTVNTLGFTVLFLLLAGAAFFLIRRI